MCVENSIIIISLLLERNVRETRMSVLDPIIKGITRCTGCQLQLQDDTFGKLFLGKCTVLIWLAKRVSKFNMDAIAQAIGHYIGTQYTAVSGSDKQHSPMAAVFCEDKCRLIFFPFEENGQPCVDAIVTEEFNLIAANRLNIDLFQILVRFLSYYNKCSLVTISNFTFKQKKNAYIEFIETEADVQKEEIEEKLGDEGGSEGGT